MRRVWINPSCFAMATLALTTLALAVGCSQSAAPPTKAQVESTQVSAPAIVAEPAPFTAPTKGKAKPIALVAKSHRETVRTTGGQDQDPQPPSVLKKRAPKSAASPQAPQPLRSPSARQDGDFEAVEQRARQLIDQAYGLADRGAIYSSRSDLLTAIQVLCEASDAMQGNRRCTKALGDAMTAMEEASDFVVSGDSRIDLPKVIAGHQTPVLKEVELDSLNTIAAMQQYYTFAQSKLIEAGNGSQAASEALCGLGKVARHLPATDSASRRNALVKALVFQQSAAAIWDKNYHAINELGVLYAQLGRPQDAKQLLLEAAEATNWPTAWSNLARVHTQLGEPDLAELALHEARQSQKSNANMTTAKAGPQEFRWVSPEQFIAEGPSDGPQSMARRPQAGPR